METDQEPPPGGGNVTLLAPSANISSDSDRLIVDGLLCSIVKAQTRTSNDYELVEAIGRDIDEKEVSEAWSKLFNYFSDAVDENRKIFIKDIKRQTVKAMIEDLVKFLRLKDKNTDLKMLVLPWSYNMWPFLSDNEQERNYVPKRR